MKLYFVVTEIDRGLIIRLSPLYVQKNITLKPTPKKVQKLTRQY